MDDVTEGPLNKARLAELDDLEIEGEPSLVVELIDDFLHSAEVTIEALRTALANGAFDEVQRSAHSLKGSSLNIGADGVGRLCAEMEMNARNGTEEVKKDLLERIDRELEGARSALLVEQSRRAGKG
jgi:HPt (histidine-containing phosphotransfer) domain-containing protein